MATGRHTPAFNLKVVIRETDLKPDTIRAWERRYGLPEPDRTPGGHRLYSQHDIDTLKWLIERQDEGLSISRAVDLWHTIRDEGNDPLVVMPLATDLPGEYPAVVPEDGSMVSALRDAWLDACLAFDEARAERVIVQALGLFPPEVVAIDILQEGLAAIGMGWYTGEVSVQQEHFTSELAVRRLESMVAAAAPPNRAGRILVACPPEEDHVFAPLLVTLLLRRRGWDVIYLGANVPVMRLAETIRVIKPRLVILPAQTLNTAATLLAAARAIREEGVMVGYGGGIFRRIPELVERIPGRYLGNSLAGIPEQVEQLAENTFIIPEAAPPPPGYEQALAEFLDRQAYVEAAVWEMMAETDLNPAHIEQANDSLSDNIAAALALGEIAAINVDIDWIRGMLVNFDLPTETLLAYLVAYRKASEKVLDAAEPLVSGALDDLIEQWE